MRDFQIIRGFQEHDNVINQLHRRLKEVEKGGDRIYLRSLTHEMMWDCLMSILTGKGLFTKEQFDAALKELADKTQAAMNEEAKKNAEPKVTVVSDVPEIPVSATAKP